MPGTLHSLLWDAEYKNKQTKSLFGAFLYQVDMGGTPFDPDGGDIP